MQINQPLLYGPRTVLLPLINGQSGPIFPSFKKSTTDMVSQAMIWLGKKLPTSIFFWFSTVISTLVSS